MNGKDFKQYEELLANGMNRLETEKMVMEEATKRIASLGSQVATLTDGLKAATSTFSNHHTLIEKNKAKALLEKINTRSIHF